MGIERTTAAGAARAAIAATAVVVATTVLAACGPASEPRQATASSTPAASPTASSTPAASTPTTTPAPVTTPGAPAPSPSEDAQGITLPTCEAIMDEMASSDLYGDRIVPIPGDGVAPADILPGPAAQKALGEADSAIGCMWGIPNSDGGFHMIVADLPQTASEELMAALRASDAFTESTIGGAAAFGMDYDTELGRMSVTYAIEGIKWVAVVSSIFDWQAAAPAIERAQQAWIAANPDDV